MLEQATYNSRTILNVKQIIDEAFGDLDKNTVNFKLIQTVLYLLARQLRFLERKVLINVAHDLSVGSGTSIQVTEVKIKAKDKKRSGSKSTDSSKSPSTKSTPPGGSSTDRKDAGVLKKIGTKKEPDASATADDKKGGKTMDTQEFYRLLDEFETQREQELRLINQRAKSYEERGKTPTPIASLDSKEALQEKLLVVQRHPSQESAKAARPPELNIVTYEEFEELTEQVRELQKRFGLDADLMKDLRRGASLTDAMGAIQLSSRLEAAENLLKCMIGIVTDVVKATPGKDKQKGDKDKDASARLASGEDDDDEEKKYITYGELQAELKKLEEKMAKYLSELTGKSISNSEQTQKSAQALERKLDDALTSGARMGEVEALLNEYADKVNNLDSSLTSQLGNFQEQLTQMQNDLEVGVETMTEALSNTGGDETVIAELNSNFNNLQADFEVMTALQKELNDAHDELTAELANLWAQIEALKDCKADRDEVVDALRDKAGIAQLNALVSVDYFNAVQGDFQKRIGAAYDKFNSQEAVWQKAIDDLLRNIDEKADRAQVEYLRSEIERYLNTFNARMQFIADIVGEPTAAAVTKRMFREAACLCCGSPAIMITEESEQVPELPAKTKPGGEGSESKPKGDGDNNIRPCIPGLPIPHARDPRSNLCRRYCGGSHTLVANLAPNKIPSSLTVDPIETTDQKKVVKTGEKIKKPCLPCNIEENKDLEAVVIETEII